MNLRKICLFSACLLLCSCSAIRLFKRDASGVVRSIKEDYLTTGKLSIESAQMARMSGLSEQEAIEDGGTFIENSVLAAKESLLLRRFVESELALAKGINLGNQLDPAAASYFLRSGQISFETMLSPVCANSVNLLCDNFKFYYLRAILGLLEVLEKANWEPSRIGNLALPGGKRYSLSLEYDEKHESPLNYKSITPSVTIGLEGLANRHSRYGFGLALTACRDKSENEDDRYLPDIGICLPLTVVVKYQAGAEGLIDVSLEFHNALKEERVVVGSQELDLAGGFSAPFGSMVARTGLTNFDGFFRALSGSDDFLEKTGFYSLEPYDENKIPLITVHGLFSHPITWTSLHNDLNGDPVVRKNYQIWHYEYSTNLPILGNAKTFRDKLDDLESYLLKRSKNPQKRPGMVVIAHSMGGLLTRTAVTGEGEAFRDYLLDGEKFKELPADMQQELDGYLNLQRKPYIDRVVFVAVPHRGSTIATSWIGWIGRQLMSIPKRVIARSAQLTASIKHLIRPDLQTTLGSDDFTSISGLAPTNPSLLALARAAVAADIPCHSIIGNQNGATVLTESTDGVVEYSSSHLEGCQSELVVHSDHAAHLHPLAVQEIKRILYLHLDARNNP